MSSKFDDFRSAFTKSAKKKGNLEDILLADEIFTHTNTFITTNHLMSSSAALENLSATPVLIQKDNGPDAHAIETFVDKCLVPEAMKFRTCMELSRIIHGDNTDVSNFMKVERPDAKNVVPLSRIYGVNALDFIANDGRLAMESFGENTDKLTSDTRLNVALTVMKAHRSLIDRVLARQAVEDIITTIKIPSPEVYNLDLSQNSSAAVRYDTHTRHPMIELNRNPNPVNTTPKLIVPLSENDNDDAPQMLGTSLRTGMQINLFDLSMDANKIGYSHIDWTDLISDGGAISVLYIAVTKTDTTTTPATITTEMFPIPVKFHRDAQFTTLSNVNDSGDRGVQLQAVYALTSTSTQSDKAASVILAEYTAAKIVLDIGFNSRLSIKTGYISGSGQVSAKLISSTPGGSVSAPLVADFANLSFAVVSYDTSLYFSEENLRKTTAAIRMNYKQLQFLIPVGRTFIVDYSLANQDVGEDVISTVNQAINLGNDARGLGIIADTFESVSERLTFEAANPDIDWYNSVAQDYAAGTLSLPHVYVGELDLSKTAVMRETERLGDLHSYVTSRILGLLADAYNKSLYLTTLEAGEKPVFKVVTSTVIKSLLFGITNYYNNLNDKADIADGADYSLYLPDGTRLDIVGTTFKAYEGLMVLFPVRESDPESVTSFGKLLDRGTYTAQYTPVSNGAANKRIICNSREIVFPTNPMGISLTVIGVDEQLQLMLDGASI